MPMEKIKSDEEAKKKDRKGFEKKGILCSMTEFKHLVGMIPPIVGGV
jgi:hypothetical protein